MDAFLLGYLAFCLSGPVIAMFLAELMYGRRPIPRSHAGPR